MHAFGYILISALFANPFIYVMHSGMILLYLAILFYTQGFFVKVYVYTHKNQSQLLSVAKIQTVLQSHVKRSWTHFKHMQLKIIFCFLDITNSYYYSDSIATATYISRTLRLMVGLHYRSSKEAQLGVQWETQHWLNRLSMSTQP